MTIAANTPYAIPPGPHRVLFSTSQGFYATTVGGSYNAITNSNLEPGALFDGGFIQQTAGGPRLVICKKVSRLDTYAGKVAQSNPQYYWRLGEKVASSVLLYDSMFNMAHLTKGSAVVLNVAGPLGDGNTGVTLDGTINSVSSGLVGSSPWTGWTAISFEAWVNNPAWQGATHEVIISLGGVGIYFSVNAAQPFMSIHTGSQYTSTATPTVAANTWTHLVGTWESGDRVRHYINGVEVTTSNPTTRTGALSASSAVHLGAFSGSTLFYSGSMDDISLYNRKLTANEISEHYAARNTK